MVVLAGVFFDFRRFFFGALEALASEEAAPRRVLLSCVAAPARCFGAWSSRARTYAFRLWMNRCHVMFGSSPITRLIR
jgi:hypothetical protein